MKRSTKRIFLPAHFTAAVVVGTFAYWLNTKFPAMNWSSPWLWAFLAFCYLMIAGPFVLGATIHETAKHVTDKDDHARRTAPPRPSQLPPSQPVADNVSQRSSPRRPVPKALQIIGVVVGAPVVSLVALFVGLMIYYLFNPTPEMLAKAETRRINAEVQRIEAAQHLKAAERR